MASQIVLVSRDSVKFPTSSQFSVLSGLIHNVLQDYPESEEIPIPHVSSATLSLILQFAAHHNHTLPSPLARPIKSKHFRDNVNDPWDADFIERLSEDDLIEMVLATNYLDMKSLMDLCLVKIASAFKDKTVEEVRKEYGIVEEFTPDVEEKLKTDFPWAMEAEHEDS
jgi:S-phase kinase-associated protein 1